MDNVNVESTEMQKEPRSFSLGVMTGGTFGMWLLGAGTGVLAIIVLAGVQGPLARVLTAIAILGAAGALLLSSGVIVSRLTYFMEKSGVQPVQSRFVRSLSAELVAGCAGVVLGILVLVNVYPVILTSCAVIIFGGAIALGGLSRSLSNLASYQLGAERTTEGMNYLFTRQLTIIDAGGSMLVGLSLIALGIVALYDINPVLLSAVGLLGIGASFFLGASSVGGAMVTALEHRDVDFYKRHEFRHAA